MGTSNAVIGGDVYNNLAFMVLPIYVALERVDGRILEAARDLYSNGRQVFLRVVLPAMSCKSSTVSAGACDAANDV